MEAEGSSQDGPSLASRKKERYILTLRGQAIALKHDYSLPSRCNDLKKLEKALTKATTFHVKHVHRAKQVIDAMKKEGGAVLGKNVRLLAALKGGGFREVDARNVSLGDALESAGVHMTVEGRRVKITDSQGSYEFTDDFYWTGCRWMFGDFLSRSGLIFPLLDQRDVNSVNRQSGGVEAHEWLVSLLASGTYACKGTRFYGAEFSSIRKPVMNYTFGTLRRVDLGRRRVGAPAQVLLLGDEDFLRVMRGKQEPDVFKMKNWCSKAHRIAVRKALNQMGLTLSEVEARHLPDLREFGITRAALANYIACNMQAFNNCLGRRYVSLSVEPGVV